MATTRSGESALYRLFSRQAERAGDRAALRDGRGTLSYAEASRRAGVLAAAIGRLCPAPGARIGLHLGRTSDLVVAVLAVARAGHAYVPLDPAYPADRLRFMAADSAVSLILSDRDVPAELSVAPSLRVDRLDWSTEAAPAPVEVGPDASAYVIYTSGSTGRPKGVEVRQSSVVAMVNAVCARHRFDDRDVWTLFHSHCFDFSVWEMWGALATGAALVVVPADTALSPRGTIELLTRERVTVMSIVPSVFRHLAAAVRRMPERPTSLRRIIFGGEGIDVADIHAWRRSVGPGCEFVNTYGITETTVFVSTRPLLDAELDAAGGDRAFATDLGVPLAGWEIEVLDERGAPVDRGQTGEIWVAGDGVAVGYLNRPDLTEARFRSLEVSGRPARRFYRSGDLATRTERDLLCYAGRVDDQVKINGFRIEPGEIEATLRRVAGVSDVAVIAGRSRIGGTLLTAYYATEPEVPELDLADQARALLPPHLLPGRFVHLAELPRNPSGKTDRRALAEADGPLRRRSTP